MSKFVNACGFVGRVGAKVVVGAGCAVYKGAVVGAELAGEGGSAMWDEAARETDRQVMKLNTWEVEHEAKKALADAARAQARAALLAIQPSVSMVATA